MSKYVKQTLRACYAAVVTGLGSLATVLVGDADFGSVTAGQWVTIVLGALIAFGGVYGISNQRPTP